ncbi:MAG: metallophosphoesterase [Candidatus Pacearchaeota archaeon]
MKILALGDPHGKLPKKLDKIIKKNKIDLIICVGEVFPINRMKNGTGYADFKNGERIIKKISSYNLPSIILRGNMFFNKKEQKYFSNLLKKYNLDYKEIGSLKIKNLSIIICDMIFERWAYNWLNDKSFLDKVTKTNKSREVLLNKLLKENPNSILVCHNPPYGYVDVTYSKKHVGSRIIFKAIKSHQPKIVLCGHIHEAKGKAKIGKTIIYNLGCCGDYKIIVI